MNRGVKQLGNVNNLSADYNEAKENPTLVGNGPSAFESMSKAMAETEKKDFIQGVIPPFITPSSQNVIERINNKDYISPNNNTDIRERVRVLLVHHRYLGQGLTQKWIYNSMQRQPQK